MTPAQFTAALARTRLKDRAAGAARRVLVDGLGKTGAGRECGLTPQAVAQAVARIEREHLGVVGCPRNWAVLTVCVPYYTDEYDAIKAAEEKAWRAAGLLV